MSRRRGDPTVAPVSKSDPRRDTASRVIASYQRFRHLYGIQKRIAAEFDIDVTYVSRILSRAGIRGRFKGFVCHKIRNATTA